MCPTVLILGAEGMLGRACAAAFTQSDIAVFGTQRSDATSPSYFDVSDLTAEERLETLLETHRPAYVVNAIAVLKASIKSSQHSGALAHLVNAEFPHRLAASAGRYGASVFHVSTDGVFAPSDTRILTEDVPADASDVYGLTKRLGEPPNGNTLVLRTSIVGRDPRHRRGLVEWFLSQEPGARLTGYANRRWTGVTAPQLAHFFTEIVKGGHFARLRETSGTFHFVPNEPLTKFDLLNLLNTHSGKRMYIERGLSTEGEGTTLLATLYPTIQTIAGSVPSWDELIEHMLGGSFSREE